MPVKDELTEEIKQFVAQQLHCAVDCIPVLINEDDTSLLLDVKPKSLSVYRSTGRKPELSFIKSGRGVRYRTSSVIRLLVDQCSRHSGGPA